MDSFRLGTSTATAALTLAQGLTTTMAFTHQQQQINASSILPVISSSPTQLSLSNSIGGILKAFALSVLVLWTIVANSLVFIVLYKNPRLQTVPNLLVGNLAFSDLCLGLIVLPLSSIYACAGEWLFPETLCQIFVSADILCSTASIWNLSIVGLDRYWAITTPVAYLNKRNKKTAGLMIASVWLLSALISLAPLLGWKQVADSGNLVRINGTWQCTFLDLPSYTIYSATGSFFIPTIVMFFVYFKIYEAFAKHRARQIYRQKVIRKHIESTILHEISHVLPTSDEFAKEMDEDEEEEEDEDEEECESGSTGKNSVEEKRTSLPGYFVSQNGTIYEEDEELDENDAEQRHSGGVERKNNSFPNNFSTATEITTISTIKSEDSSNAQSSVIVRRTESENSVVQDQREGLKSKEECTRKPVSALTREEKCVAFKTGSTESNKSSTESLKKEPKKPFKAVVIEKAANGGEQLAKKRKERRYPNSAAIAQISYEKVKRHKQRKERSYRKSIQSKPRAISAAKERRGVKVLGIILGCFTICWTPFFIMYFIVQFCTVNCRVNQHIEMFITWLGYSNSAMNPIIYTVFNKDYQIALKRLFVSKSKASSTNGRVQNQNK